jgi:MFS family permease
MLPMLLVSLMLSTANAFYWTAGPLFSETLGLGHFSGLFLASFIAPALIVGWLIGGITRRFGQRQTAVGALFFGSLIVISLGFIENTSTLVVVNFVASFILAAAYPAINGAFANFIAEAPRIETEIETIEDSSVNLGWIIGPILAGFSSDMLGYHYTFVLLGVIGALVAIIVWRIMPRYLRIASPARR